MRMSMARKIYSIILVMLIVAVVIVGIGLYSINELTESTAALGRQAKRAVNLNVMDRLVLERRTATTDIIQSVDESVMSNLIQNEMKRIADAMEAEIQSFHNNFPQPPSPTQITYVETVRKLWNEYEQLTLAAANYSLENSNNKAFRLNEGMQEFWETMDQDLEGLARIITA